MAPPRAGVVNGLELEETWLGETSAGVLGGVLGVVLGLVEGVGTEEAVIVEAPGVQVVSELPPIVMSPLQASLPAESEINNMTWVPGFKLVVY